MFNTAYLSFILITLLRVGLVGSWQYVWSCSCVCSDAPWGTGMALVPWTGCYSHSACITFVSGMKFCKQGFYCIIVLIN